MILETTGRGAGVRTRIDFKAVRESIAVKDLVQPSGIDTQAAMTVPSIPMHSTVTGYCALDKGAQSPATAPIQLRSSRKSLGAKSLRSRRQVSHSCAVPGEEK